MGRYGVPAITVGRVSDAPGVRPSSSRSVWPWSARTTLPRARQAVGTSAKVSASSGPQAMVTAPAPAPAGAEIRRTTWRWLGIGVRREAAHRPDDLLEEQEIARGERGRERRRGVGRGWRAGGARRQGRAGGEEDGVVARAQGERVHGLEDLRAGGDRRRHRVRSQHERLLRCAGEELRSGGEAVRALGARLDHHEHARVAPVVHEVVEQARVAARRDAPARRAQVGLGGDRVLVVAQVVRGVGQDVQQDHAQVGRVPLAPGGHQDREPVEHQPPEAVEVLGEVVDARGRVAAVVIGQTSRLVNWATCCCRVCTVT